MTPMISFLCTRCSGDRLRHRLAKRRQKGLPREGITRRITTNTYLIISLRRSFSDGSRGDTRGISARYTRLGPCFLGFPPPLLFICWRMDRCFGRRPNLSIVVVFIISSVKVLLWGGHFDLVSILNLLWGIKLSARAAPTEFKRVCIVAEDREVWQQSRSIPT